MQTWKAYLPDEASTAALGAALARVLQPGLVLHLHGELGAGKTSLTRSLLHSAGYTGRVKSPTYTLMEPYTIKLQGIVEWPEQAGDLLPLPDLDVFLAVEGHGRAVKLAANSAQGALCLDHLHFSPTL